MQTNKGLCFNPDEVDIILRDRLRQAIKQFETSISEISKITGISRHTIRKILDRKTENVKCYTALLIAKAFGGGLSEFLDFDYPLSFKRRAEYTETLLWTYDFENNIKKIRLERGYRRTKVEQIAGLSMGMISRLERGINISPYLYIIVRIANALDCNLDELVTLKNIER